MRRQISAHGLVVVGVILLVTDVVQAQFEGTIVAWGRNGSGQCNVPLPNVEFTAVEGGSYHSLGVKSDGTIIAWGSNQDGQCDVPPPNSNFVAIAAGWSHSLGAKTDGSIVAWGSNQDGQCNVPAPNAGFVAIAAGSYHSLGVRTDGTIAAWGSNTNADGDYVGQCVVPAPNEDFVAVAGGGYHSLGLKSDGSIVAWGANGQGQCNVPAPNSNFVAVAGGSYHSVGLRSDGSIVAWGANWDGQCNVPAPNENFVAIASGSGHCLGLNSNGSIVAWGYNGLGQCNVPMPNEDFVSIAAGKDHSLGLRDYNAIMISGTIRDYRANGMPRIPIAVNGESTRFVVTDDQGFYQTLVPWHWQGTIVPQHPGFAFTPTQRSYDQVEQDLFDQNYVGAMTGVCSIDDIQVYEEANGAPISDFLGLLVETEGVVYVTPGTFSYGGGYIQSEDGGVNYYFDYPAPDLQIGDQVRIEGYVWSDVNEELYIGQPVVEVLGQTVTPQPSQLSIDQIITDYENIGTFIKTTGLVTEKGILPDEGLEYIRLQEHGESIVAYNDPDAGVNFDGVNVGESWAVQGPCTKRLEDIRVAPRFQTDLQQVDAPAWYVATDGNDENPGSEELPFRTIQRGILAAYDGDPVLIADGVYTGDGNRDIDFMGKAITVRSKSGIREACVVDAQGSMDEPHVGFAFTEGETRETLLEGLTITGGYPAGISCRLSTANILSSPTIRNVVLRENPGAGLSADGSVPWGVLSVRIVSSLICNNARSGIKIDHRSGDTTIDSCTVAANTGHGVSVAGGPFGSTQINDTHIQDNTGEGVSFWGASEGYGVTIRRCSIYENAGWGITTGSDWNTMAIDTAVIRKNGLGGVYNMGITSHSLNITNTQITYNNGDGVLAYGMLSHSLTITESYIVGNSHDGIVIVDHNKQRLSDRQSSVRGEVTRCYISDNQGTGIKLSFTYYNVPMYISQTVVTRNSDGGVILNMQDGDFGATYLFDGMTIVDNVGHGMNCGPLSTNCELVNCLIANNTGQALVTIPSDLLAINCSDFYGNDDGDWVENIANYYGIDGNISVDPLFCDVGAGDYTLAGDSPCADGNHPDGAECGQIGALGVGCGPIQDTVWIDITELTPLGDSGNSMACAWGDYDGDGDDDLYVTNVSSANHLYRNDGNSVFNDVTAPPLDDGEMSNGCAWGDYDGDGDLDLYLCKNGPNRLFRNDGISGFTDQTSGPLGDIAVGTCSWIDYDRDGDLDLCLANINGPNRLLRNDGGGGFADVAPPALAEAGLTHAAIWGDYDNDGDLDLYLSVNGANVLLNNQAGILVAVTPPLLVDAGNGVGAAWGDYDNDGWLDLYLVNAGSPNRLFHNEGDGEFTDATAGPLGETAVGRSVAWVDIDNDGDLDLHITNNGSTDRLLRNDNSAFVDATDGIVGDSGSSHGAAFADIDGDGDLDLHLCKYGQENRLLRNDTSSEKHWLHVSLNEYGFNREAIGARVRVVSGGMSQIREILPNTGYLSQHSIAAEFGLGQATAIDSLIVRWPDGEVTYETAVVDQRITIERSTGVAVGEAPRAFALAPPYPNPFNAATTIQFDLPEPQRAEVAVYSIDGRLVRSLLSQQLPAGRHAVQWDGKNDKGSIVASGMYFYRIEAGPYRATQKMVLAK